MATLPSSSSPTLFEQVRQHLQRNLAMPVLPYAVENVSGQAEAQLWQIGSAICLLALKPVSFITAKPIILAGHLPKEYPAILVCDYISGKHGAALRAQGVCYADAPLGTPGLSILSS